MSGEKQEPTPRFAAPGELTDEALTPGEFRHFRREIRDELVAIKQQMGRLVDRLEQVLNVAGRTSELETRVNRTDDRVDKHHERLGALEAAVFGK